MKRRSFFVVIWLLVAVSWGTNAAIKLAADETVGYAIGVLAVLNAGLAGYYWLSPEPVERPDDPAPRRWYKLAGVAAVTLVGGLGLLAVTVGS